MRQVCSNAQADRIGAEFINDSDGALVLDHVICRCCVRHDDIDAPPLQLLDQRGNAVEMIIGEEQFHFRIARIDIASIGCSRLSSPLIFMLSKTLRDQR
jgi:hypothetical protein